MTVLVAPSLLAADFARLGAEVESAVAAGADLLHVDVMDGRFVPPISFGDVVVSVVKRRSSLLPEVHLMTESPQDHFDTFSAAGAGRIIFHVEAERHAPYALDRLRRAGVGAGLALNPGTPVTHLFECLELCDVVTVMTVNPGWGGQTLLPRSFGRIEAIAEEIYRRGCPTLVEADGGVNLENAARLVAAGARILVAGSSVFGAADRADAVSGLRRPGDRPV